MADCDRCHEPLSEVVVAPRCEQHGQAGADLHTPKGSTVLGNIKVAFGQVVARELLELNCSSSSEKEEEPSGKTEGAGEDDEQAGDGFGFKASGYISNANYNMKKSVFMLFINNRLVGHTGRSWCPRYT